MANRDFNAVAAPETEVKILTGYFTAVNGAVPTVFSGCIRTATRDAEGVWTIYLQDKYPALLYGKADVDGTAGDHAHMDTANYSASAGTVPVNAWTKGGVADDCDAKRISVLLVVRNSTSRRAT